MGHERVAALWAHVSTGAQLRGRTHSLRNSDQPMAPTAPTARPGRSPASYRTPIKISIPIAIKNANTGLSSTTAPPIDHMAQVGRLLTASRPADTDLGYLAPLWSTTRPGRPLTLAELERQRVFRVPAHVLIEPLPLAAATARWSSRAIGASPSMSPTTTAMIVASATPGYV